MEDLIKKWEAQLEILTVLRKDLELISPTDINTFIVLDNRIKELMAIIKSMKK